MPPISGATSRRVTSVPVPVMLGNAVLAGRMAQRLLELGIYVVAFSFPVVPQGRARIRVQISATHSQADLERAVAAFTAARGDVGGSLSGRFCARPRDLRNRYSLE